MFCKICGALISSSHPRQHGLGKSNSPSSSPAPSAIPALGASYIVYREPPWYLYLRFWCGKLGRTSRVRCAFAKESCLFANMCHTASTQPTNPRTPFVPNCPPWCSSSSLSCSATAGLSKAPNSKNKLKVKTYSNPHYHNPPEHQLTPLHTARCPVDDD